MMQVVAGCGDGALVRFVLNNMRDEYQPMCHTVGCVRSITSCAASGSFFTATACGTLVKHSLDGSSEPLLNARQCDILSITFPPADDSQAVTTDADGCVCVWNIGTRSLQRQRRVQDAGAALCATFCGALVLVGFQDGAIRAFNFADQLAPAWDIHSAHASLDASGVRQLAITFNSNTLASGGASGDVRLWCSHTRRLVRGSTFAASIVFFSSVPA